MTLASFLIQPSRIGRLGQPTELTTSPGGSKQPHQSQSR